MSRHQFHMTVFLTALASTCYGQPSAYDVEEPTDAAEKRQCSLEFGRSLIKDAQAQDFVAWDLAALPAVLKAQIDSYLSSVLRTPFQPYGRTQGTENAESSDLSVRVYAARDHTQDDLVEYRWTSRGRQLRLLSGRNAMKVDFHLSEVPACRKDVTDPACVMGVRDWVEETLKLHGEYRILRRHIKYRVDLPWPVELSDGTSFSSAPEENFARLPGMPEWHRRVDAVVDNGILSILVYKKIGQLMTYQDGSKWFDEAFRAQVRAKSPNQGKTPSESGR